MLGLAPGDPDPFSGQPFTEPTMTARISFQHYETDPPRFAYVVHYDNTLKERPNAWLNNDPYLVPFRPKYQPPYVQQQLNLRFTMDRVLAAAHGVAGPVPETVSVCGWVPRVQIDGQFEDGSRQFL